MTPTRLFGASLLSLALAIPTLPAFASMTPNFTNGADMLVAGSDAFLIDVKQGRSGTGKRGRDRDRDDDRGRDRDRDDDRGRDRDRGDDRGRDRGFDDNSRSGSGSGRDKPRIPGGSGCDDPGDLLEHPECAVGGVTPTSDPFRGSGSGRDKPRIPGGSGCDDPGDLLEHPECRL